MRSEELHVLRSPARNWRLGARYDKPGRGMVSAKEPAWLELNLGAPTLRLVDLRPRDRYLAGHVPGAVWLDVRATLLDDTGAMVSAPELALVMSGLGVGNGHTVVLVDDAVPVY